jgi:nucleotide-binding universal stress UspA family protein
MQSTESPKPYVIVVGIDYSKTGELALEKAFDLARLQPGAEPHVVHVATAYGPLLRLDADEDFRTVSLEQASQQLDAYVREKLNAFTSKYGTGGFQRVCTHERVGAPAEEVAQLASDLEAALIVVGTHGRRGVRRVLIGSIAEGVVRLAPCPVLVVRPNASAELPKIEAPCAACIARRQATNGKELWCEEHSRHRGHLHSYNYVERQRENSGAPLMY